MSLPSSVNQPAQKPGTNVYTVMLILSFCAIVTATILLAMEVGRFGPGVPWSTSGGGSWRLKSFVRCCRLVKRIAMYEQDKARKIYAVWQGWWDAVRGHMGPRRGPRKQSSAMRHHADP